MEKGLSIFKSNSMNGTRALILLTKVCVCSPFDGLETFVIIIIITSIHHILCELKFLKQPIIW